ncbi:MAG: N-formylglutamate amidohydrolase [Daejeonella sp.]
MSANYTFIKGTSPIVVTAIHDGHQTREALTKLFNLNDEERLREEDPFTAKWLSISDNKIVVHHSRFETDVNRPRDKAVYRIPDDAWGLKIWKNDLPEEVAKASLAIYDDFYRTAKSYFDDLFKLHDKIIVYDIHSYNHRREAEDKAADPQENPEINIGTKNMDHKIWQPVVDTLINHFNSFDYDGRNLDARENIKFKGGYFGQWLFENYGKKICPISIEFKKFFMDEWTGLPFEKDIQLIDELVKSSEMAVLATLKEINN